MDFFLVGYSEFPRWSPLRHLHFMSEDWTIYSLDMIFDKFDTFGVRDGVSECRWARIFNFKFHSPRLPLPALLQHAPLNAAAVFARYRRWCCSWYCNGSMQRFPDFKLSRWNNYCHRVRGFTLPSRPVLDVFISCLAALAHLHLSDHHTRPKPSPPLRWTNP